jgi:formamidopyrimidine-DNA glycosylase
MENLSLKELLELEEKLQKEKNKLNNQITNINYQINKIWKIKEKKCNHEFIRVPEIYGRSTQECKNCNYQTF